MYVIPCYSLDCYVQKERSDQGKDDDHQPCEPRKGLDIGVVVSDVLWDFNEELSSGFKQRT